MAFRSPSVSQDGVLDLGDIQYVLVAQLLRQLVEREAAAAHLTLVYFAVGNQEARPSEQGGAELRVFHRGAGDEHLAAEQHYDGQQTVHQGYAYVLQRMRRQIGYQHGDGQFRQLQFAQLPLAHEAHEQHQREENDKRANNYNGQINHPTLHIIKQFGGSYE